jgi:hypothetical protein
MTAVMDGEYYTEYVVQREGYRWGLHDTEGSMDDGNKPSLSPTDHFL